MKVQRQAVLHLAVAMATLVLNSICAHADTVYVWSNDGTIQRFNTNGVGTLLTNNLSNWNGPVGLACDNVGNLYAGYPGWSIIWRFSPDGTSRMVGEPDSVSGLAFDSTGSLYVTIPNYTEICRLTYYLGQAYFLFTPPGTNYTQSHLSYPLNLAFDSTGSIYVLNNTNASPFPVGGPNSIERFTTNFTHLGTFATDLNDPWGLAFDSAGNLFVSSSGDDLIEMFTPPGVRFSFAYGGLSSPRGLAFDSAGNLYVANSGNGTIQKITPGGDSSVFASGLNSPSSIAIFPGLNVWSVTAIKLNNATIPLGGSFQFGFTDNAGLAFTALATTNASSSSTNWTPLGGVTEISPGQYQFTDPEAADGVQRFYRIRSD